MTRYFRWELHWDVYRNRWTRTIFHQEQKMKCLISWWISVASFYLSTKQEYRSFRLVGLFSFMQTREKGKDQSNVKKNGYGRENKRKEIRILKHHNTWTYWRSSCSKKSVFTQTLSSQKIWLLLFKMLAIVYPKAISPPRRRTLTSNVIRGDIMNGVSVTHS